MNNKLLMKIAAKWGAIYGLLSGIVVLMNLLLKGTDGELPSGTTMFFMGIIGIGMLFLIVYFLFKAVQEYEYVNRKSINVGDAWKMGGFYFLVLVLVDLVLSVGTGLLDSSTMIGANVLASTIGIFIKILYLLVSMYILGKWRTYEKAGLSGWSAIIPLYSAYQQTIIGKKDTGWFFMLFIPVVGIAFGIMLTNAVTKAFGKDEGFTVGLLLLPFIFYPILGFGDSRWIYGNEVEEDEFVPSSSF